MSRKKKYLVVDRDTHIRDDLATKEDEKGERKDGEVLYTKQKRRQKIWNIQCRVFYREQKLGQTNNGPHLIVRELR